MSGGYVRFLCGPNTYTVIDIRVGMYTDYDIPDQLDAAIEHVMRLVIANGDELRFGGPVSRRVFHDWVDARPDRDELVRLLDLGDGAPNEDTIQLLGRAVPA